MLRQAQEFRYRLLGAFALELFGLVVFVLDIHVAIRIFLFIVFVFKVITKQPN
jgi:hypothetical protein